MSGVALMRQRDRLEGYEFDISIKPPSNEIVENFPALGNDESLGERIVPLQRIRR
jgi:hypothetical protein